MNVKSLRGTKERIAFDKIKAKHRRCPARVLKGGRCEKGCPFYGADCPNEDGPSKYKIDVDHERLVYDGDKPIYIWHNHSQPEGEHLDNLKTFCTFHGLAFEIKKTINQQNQSVSDWNVCVYCL